jgi:predicted nucleic acid-binding protein
VILLDTNVVSEARHPNGSPRVKAAVRDHREDLWLSVVVLGEILFGIRRLEPSPKREDLERYYGELRRDYAERVLDVTREVAEVWGEARAARRRMGRPLAATDGLIAATALVHNLTLWTRNTGDFDATGVRLFNPWVD